jgi:hypothetical protein
MQRWNLATNLSEIKGTKIFSGGASNILDSQGNLLRNTERDEINDWLTSKNVRLYDPQIHPDTHGREYNFDVDHVLEIAARKQSIVSLYEVSPRTFGGVTSLEIAMDEFIANHAMIIFFSDGKEQIDVIPDHSPQGHPLFVPYGIHGDIKAQNAHYKEMVKNANRMRKYLMRFAKDLSTLTITFNSQSRVTDIEITPFRMHAAHIYKAVVTAAQGKPVIVNFVGDEDSRDKQGNPLYLAPENPPPVQQSLLLDQYLDEGNALRRAISNLVKINVHVRVVYTQRDVINALQDLMRIKNFVFDD